MAWRTRWHAIVGFSWFVLASCGGGCARAVPRTPTQVESPPAMVMEPRAESNWGEPRLSDDEP
jgi:hypothetical protein